MLARHGPRQRVRPIAMAEPMQEQPAPQWLDRILGHKRWLVIAAILLAVVGSVTAAYALSLGWGILVSEIAFALAVLSAISALLTVPGLKAVGSLGTGEANGQLSAQRSIERYPRKIIKLVTVLVVCGMAAMLLYSVGQNAATSRAQVLLFAVLALEALAAFGFGALAGFLFGIPRSLRGQPGETKSQPAQPASPAPHPAPGQTGDATPSGGQPETAPSSWGYASNTSLEEISDWLTKIIVGFGLINLKAIPPYLRHVAEYFSGLSPCAQGCIPVPASVSMSNLIYFSVAGFFFAYLLTRLLLPRAFLLAEREAWTALHNRQERMAGELNEAATIALTNEARVIINARPGEEELNKALEWIAKALNFSPRYYVAYIEKGRALKRLSQLKHDQQLLREALEAVNKAQQLAPRPYYAAFYNAACYKALLGRPAEEVAADLKQALELYPPLKELAAKDDDLASVQGNEQIKQLLSS